MADSRRPTAYCRFEHDGRHAHGRIEGETIHVLSADPIGGTARETGATLPLAGARLLAPVVPGKIVCVGRNYRSHLGDRAELPVPGLFAKLANAVTGPGAPIPYPADAQDLHPEGELVVVIGKAGRAIPESEAMAHVFGLTCGLDMSERVWQKSDLQWLRAKSSDGFGPLGPVLVAGLAPDDLLLTTRINGAVMQSERTSLLINPVPRLIAFISRYLRLEAGDVIFTGTPGTTSAVRPGDVVEVEIEGIGRLRNPVVLA